jgi:hypothetical protein
MKQKPSQFADSLSTLMNKAGITNDTLAGKLDVNPITISRWKKCQSKPPRDQVVKLTQYLRFAQTEKGLKECNNFFKTAEYAPLSVEEQKKLFPQVPVRQQASNQIGNRIIDQTGVIEEKTQNFVGRQFVFEAINKFILANPRGYFIVQGEPGIGKSALAAQFVKNQCCVHHFNIRAGGINTASRFLENVCAQLITTYQLDYQTLPVQATQDGVFFDKLLEIVPDKKLIIMVDGLDEVEETDMPGVNKLYLPSLLPQGVYIVVTTRPGQTLRIDCEQTSLFIEPDSAENLADIREYIAKAVEPLGIARLDNEEFIKHQGNFRYLRYVLPENGTEPTGLMNYYEDHWQRMKGRDERERSEWLDYKLKVVAALTEASSSIPIKRIAKYAGIKRSRIQTILDEWRAFLCVDEDKDKCLCYRFYHDSFRCFLANLETVKEECVDLKAANKQLS